MTALDSHSKPIQFFAIGEPKGQPRARAFAMKGGRGIRMYDPGTAEGWKGCVAASAEEWKGLGNIQPLRLVLDFFIPRPKSHFRSGKNANLLRDDAPVWHTSTPDADNFAKAVMDAITQIGIWKDDSQVCHLTVTKLYTKPGEPNGCSVTIGTL